MSEAVIRSHMLFSGGESETMEETDGFLVVVHKRATQKTTQKTTQEKSLKEMMIDQLKKNPRITRDSQLRRAAFSVSSKSCGRCGENFFQGTGSFFTNGVRQFDGSFKSANLRRTTQRINNSTAQR